MLNSNRDRFTTASSQADKALTDFQLMEDGQSVDDLAAKIFSQGKQSYAQAHLQAVRLLATVQ